MRTQVVLSRHDRNPEPIAAIQEDKVRRCDAHTIHLRQQVFNMPIGVEFLNFAHTEVGNNELKPVFREYAQWFKGKHQLVWSAGLRSLLLHDAEERLDLELAQQPEEEAVLLGQLTQSQWQSILCIM